MEQSGCHTYQFEFGKTKLNKQNQSKYTSFNVKLEKFGVRALFETVDLHKIKKRFSLSFWVKNVPSCFFKAYLCILTAWITNSDSSAEFSTTLKFAHLQKGLHILSASNYIHIRADKNSKKLHESKNVQNWTTEKQNLYHMCTATPR